MASMLNLDEIVEKALKALTGVMSLNWGFVMLVDERERQFQVHSVKSADSRNRTSQAGSDPTQYCRMVKCLQGWDPAPGGLRQAGWHCHHTDGLQG